MRRFARAAKFAAQIATPPGASFLALVAFVQIGLAAPASEEARPRASEPFRPDQIILKLSDDRAKSLDLGDGGALSTLLLRHGAVSQHRAFVRPGSRHAPIETAAQGAERARLRFAERAARAARVRETPDLENTFVVQLADSADILQAIAELAAQPGVVYAEPNLLYHAMEIALPDEPFIPDDRYLSEDGIHFSGGAWGQEYPDLWGIEKIRAIEGWNEFDLDGSGDFDASEIRPGEHVVVAVIDSGLDVDHPDIANNLWNNPAEIPDNEIDDDGNGLVDDVIGWDFVDGDGIPEDRVGHGTHVSGTIAAHGDNEIGVIGVAPWAKIMVLKSLGDSGSGDALALANAVRYAADMGADIISASWGGFGASQTLNEAFRYAHDLGVLSVAAAGNSDANVASISPANLPEVFAVAATDPNDVRAAFSNFGAEIDVTAPGVAVLSLNANAGANAIAEKYPERIVGIDYLWINGTSMACPHVSGAAAVLLSWDPGRSLDELRGRLLAGAESIAAANPGFETQLGRGRIDLLESLAAEPQPVLKLIGVDQGKATAGRDASIAVVLQNQWIATSEVTATLTTESPYAIIRENQTEFAAIATGQRVNNRGDPFVVGFDASTPIGAEILFDLALEAVDGYRETLPFSVYITHFANVTRQTGLPVFDILPWRATLHDYDGDGDADAQLIGLFNNSLYENSGGSFAARGGSGGIGTSQGLFFDIDNDDDQDLFMAGFNIASGSEFLLNTGGGNFSDITDPSGIRGLRAFATAALDYDGDGWVDFVSGSNPIASADRPSGVSLMRNNGDHTFTDVTARTCLDPATQLDNGQILVFDFDDDADSDLLFVSPFGVSLYQDNSDGTFSDVTVKAGLTPFRRNKEGCAAATGRARRKTCDPGASMGGAVGDYDNDGHIDIFLTGRRGEDQTPFSTLYRNDGDGGFIDVTAESGDLAADDISGIHWGNAFFDYDNDGDLDLYVTSENATEIDVNSLYENAGDGTFIRVTDLAFPSDTGPSGATAAIGDYNDDGALDIYALSGLLGSGGRGAFFENLTGRQRHWLVVRLRGAISHRDAYGARVTVRSGGRTQLRELHTSPVDPQPLHFGLDTATSVDEIRVRWPSGVVQILHGAAADRVIEIAEPADCVVAADYPEPGQSILECPAPASVKQAVRSAKFPDKPICRP
jgi:subtilisin family serine protease